MMMMYCWLQCFVRNRSFHRNVAHHGRRPCPRRSHRTEPMPARRGVVCLPLTGAGSVVVALRPVMVIMTDHSPWCHLPQCHPCRRTCLHHLAPSRSTWTLSFLLPIMLEKPVEKYRWSVRPPFEPPFLDLLPAASLPSRHLPYPVGLVRGLTSSILPCAQTRCNLLASVRRQSSSKQTPDSAESAGMRLSTPYVSTNHLSIKKYPGGRRRTTRMSLNVSFGSQSLFNVSTHTAPVDSSTFGCHIRVLKYALGGFLG